MASSRSSHQAGRRNRLPKTRRILLPIPLCAEELEQRTVPALIQPIGLVVGSGHSFYTPDAGNGPPPSGLAPAQILHAYGFDQLSLDGTGQTIAIVDAYNDPNMASDLAIFDQQFNLPAPPSFSQVDEHGNPATNSMPTDPTGGWEVEESLDVEWAHAIAPKANILLVEANSADTSDLLAAIDTARNAKGVVAVSMSWGGPEFGGQTSFDSHLTTPAGHPGITFLASTGDSGTPAGWPATSPNVVGVGGTTLTLDGSNNRSTETGWMGSGGSYSSVYSEPSYQSTYAKSSYVQNTLGNTVLLNSPRGSPDVSYDADPSTGFAVYDSYPYEGTPLDWVEVGGTSDAAPQWAGLIALVDQGRGALGSLDGPSQTLPALYQLGANASSYGNDFYDVTSGSNGLPAGPGYDLVTGLGSPKANNLIPALEQVGAAPPSIMGLSPNSGSTAGGYQVTISGSNLGGATVVDFGATPATIQSDTATSIQVLAPAHAAGTVDVTVMTPAGTSPTSPADQFTYTGGQSSGPTVTSVSPNSGSIAGGFEVGIFGTNLNGATGVYFGTTPASIMMDMSNQIMVLAPAALAAGTVDVTVVTPAGTSPITSADHFTYTGGQSSGPTVTGLNPSSGSTSGGYLVAISGTNLGNASAVYFGTTSATIQTDSPTGITVLAPTHALGTVDVTVVTPAGTSPITSADHFTYTGGQSSGPTVTGISPSSGSTGGGYPVAISGTNLGNASAVYFGTTSATIQTDSPTGITVLAPTHALGTVDVTVVTPAGTSPITSADHFTYTGGQSSGPTVTGVHSNFGSIAGGYQVVITGTNIVGTTAVYFGTTAGTIQMVSPMGVAVLVPAHTAGTVNVTVVTPAGTSPITSADQFTYLVPPPAVQSVSPNTGSTAGGFQVAISGVYLGGASAVYFGTTPATILGNSATSIGVLAPAHAAGAVDVTVVTPSGTSPLISTDRFTYTSSQPPAPTVQLVSSRGGSTAGGYQEAIFGTNLGSATAVYFGATPAPILGVTPTSIAVTVPAHLGGMIEVTVVTSAGTSGITPAAQFTYGAGSTAVADYVTALDAVLANWSRTTGTQQQVNYLVAEILTNGGVANFTSYFKKK